MFVFFSAVNFVQSHVRLKVNELPVVLPFVCSNGNVLKLKSVSYICGLFVAPLFTQLITLYARVHFVVCDEKGTFCWI
jgi:hypothetical protein